MYFVKYVLQMSGLNIWGNCVRLEKQICMLFRNHECNGGRHLKSMWTTNFLTGSGSIFLEKVISACTCLLC